MSPYFQNTMKIDNISTNDLEDRLEDFLGDKFDLDDKFENEILDLILEAIEQENEDSKYYKELLKLVENDKDKEAIRKIYLDDKKHFKIFSEIYKSLTGKEPIFEDEEIEIDDTLLEELEDSIEQKLENVELYRLILSSFLDVGIRDLIYEIITDEQGHAQKLTNLSNKTK